MIFLFHGSIPFLISQNADGYPQMFENHGRGLAKDLYVVAAMVVAWEAKTMREVNHALCEEMGISNLNVVCGFNHLLLASHLLIVYITVYII